MGKDQSYEYFAETFKRQVRENRDKILDDFCKAYLARMLIDNPEMDILDICLVEHQYEGPTSLSRKYWFEYKPRFED